MIGERASSADSPSSDRRIVQKENAIKPREKVSLQEFTIDTALDPRAIREAGQRAAEAGTRFTTSTIVEQEVAGPIIGYAIEGPGGSVTQMELTVAWKELGDGRRRVSLEVGEFMTDRMSIAFIPLGPKTVTAMGSLERFATRLRQELSERPERLQDRPDR